MKKKLMNNLIDSFKSVIPISIVVLIVSFIIGLPSITILAFVISSFLLIIGITLFTTGAELSIVLIGESIGDFLAKKGNKLLVIGATLIMGIIITISEPDLIVLSSEVPSIPSILMILLVALGIGLCLSIGVFRIIKRFSYRQMISFSLMIILILLYFTKGEFIPLSFDAAGVTTGPMSVPVIVAFGYGIAKMRSDKEAKSDTFGLCGYASLGPVIVLLILGMFFRVDNHFNTRGFVSGLGIANRLSINFVTSFKEIVIALSPIVGFYIISLILGNKVSKKNLFKIVIGTVFTIMGLSIFLTGVSSGFIEEGYLMGTKIASSEYKYLLIPFGMLLGFIIISAEPAIKILKRQICDLTEGSISEKMIGLCLSIGVAFAIGLSIIRVLFHIPIIYIIVPGYFIAWLLMYYAPPMFITIAYDSGGAACGALTTSFLLPLCIGICVSVNGNVLQEAFGVGSLVCLIPIITIQLLGIVYTRKLNVKQTKVFDEKIVDYCWEG